MHFVKCKMNLKCHLIFQNLVGLNFEYRINKIMYLFVPCIEILIVLQMFFYIKIACSLEYNERFLSIPDPIFVFEYYGSCEMKIESKMSLGASNCLAQILKIKETCICSMHTN